jgi:Tol biopolymer transport system component
VPVEGAGQSGGVAASSDGQHLVIGTKARLEPSDTNTAYELYVVDRDTGTRRRLAPLAASATGMTDPTNTSAPAISDDGRYVVLATTAKLLPADTNTLADVYRLDTTTWRWQLVSVPTSGAVSKTVAGTLLQTGASVYAKSPAVAASADGDVVLFYSARADLVAGDTNAKVDLFAKRMSTGAVTRVSATATGANMARVATGPALALTPDGRYALFPALSGTGPAVLYRKTLTGADVGALLAVSTVTVSGRVTEFGVFRDAGDVALSDDGRYVAFVTAAKLGTTTPTANWTAGLAYHKDLADGSVLALGTGQRTIWEHSVELDPTGRFAFYSTAAPALAGDTNGHTDVYRRDLDGGVVGPLVLVTGNAAGAHTGGPTGSVAATEYARVCAVTGDDVLVTTSQALTPVDANKQRDLYRKDLADGSVRTPLA